ncbi:PLC-like phosphodiesterase [Agrocybe pediades]|nr:PLC-like phosphodiesterase [Agrocybe pediades]
MVDSPQHTPTPVGILRRAGNILQSNGDIVHELADEPLAPSTTSRSNGLGASIRRRFLDLKARSNAITRTKSLSSPRTSSVPATKVVVTAEEAKKKRQRGHSKSLSDVTTASLNPPVLIHAATTPIARPTKPRIQQLESVTEGVASRHASQEEEISSPAIGNIRVPQLLQQGTPMTKVSAKTHKKYVFRLDADLGQIVWESKKHKIIPIENIKEIRSGDDARYHREQFQLSQDYQDRWLTIIYSLNGHYKTLHLIVATKEVFKMWDRTLRELHAVRLELMRGLGNGEMRQALWEKQYWKGADEERDQKLSFEEVEKLCRGLNINSHREDLFRLFKQADRHNRQYLDFDDFRRFVKLLKARPEIDRLYKALRAEYHGKFDSRTFEKFMLDKQQSNASHAQLRTLFKKYAGPDAEVMSLDAFVSFLLSPDNSAFSDQHKDTWQDMTRPLPEYLISSSHNTYLVGHQLVGESTIEGYIRALLHSCRSVEVDIYDGEQEPMIFHGKTLTSKVSLRSVCQVIAKYGFVASPYPIIISAEVHCGLAGQDLIAQIMTEEFGDALVRVPVDADGPREKIEQLPSPDELKGKILLKAKNFNLLRVDSLDSDGSGSFTDPSSSASESDAFGEFTKHQLLPTQTSHDAKKKRRHSEATVKGQITKARDNFMQRVRSVRKAPVLSPRAVLSQSPPPMSPSQAAQGSIPPPLSLTHSSGSPYSGTSSSGGFLKSPLPMSPRHSSENSDRSKPKMSLALLSLLVYTVGVKCRGINKKEEYAPEHMFSLSENAANKMLRFGMWDLIKHSKTHLVRTYPKGTRLSSTNYEPHKYWAAGAQLVSINWQTFDLGYMINHAMFQRNGKSGYVLKPEALRQANKDMLSKRRLHNFDVRIISAQQLPRPKDASGHEVPEKSIVDPFVEVTLYIPDWPVLAKDKEKEKDKDNSVAKDVVLGAVRPTTPTTVAVAAAASVASLLPVPIPIIPGPTSTAARAVSSRTSVVKKNGFNPIWEEDLRIPFDCVGDMMDLIFVRFVVRQEDKETDEPLAVYCASLGSLQRGYRHLPLHDSQLSQYLFSTLFVRINVTDVSSS